MKRRYAVSFSAVLTLVGPALVALALAQVPGPLRLLKVKAVADEAFRDNDKWEKEIREHIEWADREFRRFAGIGLELVAVDRWSTHESRSMSFLLGELRHRVEKGNADIVVGFTGHKPPELAVTVRLEATSGETYSMPISLPLPYIAGIAMPLGDRVVVRRASDRKQTRHTLLHEVSHLFGGMHVKEKSVLYPTEERTDFLLDAYNRQIFELTGQRDFSKDVRDLPQSEVDRLIALLRKAPLKGERDFDTNIRVGYLLLAAGDVDAAIEEFEKAVQIDPGETDAILRKVIIPELQAYTEEHGATVQSRYTLGRAYATVHEYNYASEQFGLNCLGTEAHAPSCSAMGGNLLQAGAILQAEKVLRHALELDDSLVDAHSNLGVAYLAMNRVPEAVAEFNRALELRPGDAGIHFNMGVAYLNSGLLEPAADAFRRAIELDPQSDEARARLAATLARDGQSKPALEAIRDLEKRESLPAVVLRDMAEVYFRTGDTKKAWKFLGFAKKGGLNVTKLEQQMLAGAPQPRQVKTSDLIQQAVAYYNNQKYDTALRLLQQATGQDASKPEAHYWWGRVAAAQGKPEEAAEHLQQALKLKEKYPDPYLELARLSFERTDYTGATGHLTQYLKFETSPEAEAYYLLGVCRFHQDNMGAAEESLKKAIQKDADYGDALYFMGSVFTKQKRKQEAIGELNLAVASRSLSGEFRPEAQYRLGLLYSEIGKCDEAWKHAQVAQRSGYADADQLLAKLAKACSEPPEVPASSAQGEPPTTKPAVGGQPYHIFEAVIGDSSGTVRAGQPIRGRVRLKSSPSGAEGRITLLLRLRPSDSAYWQHWLFTHIELPEGSQETAGELLIAWPPSLSTHGEIVGALAIVAPLDLETFPPKPLSNEVQVSFRVVP